MVKQTPVPSEKRLRLLRILFSAVAAAQALEGNLWQFGRDMPGIASEHRVAVMLVSALDIVLSFLIVFFPFWWLATRIDPARNWTVVVYGAAAIAVGFAAIGIGFLLRLGWASMMVASP
jgi:hypothetical protein